MLKHQDADGQMTTNSESGTAVVLEDAPPRVSCVRTLSSSMAVVVPAEPPSRRNTLQEQLARAEAERAAVAAREAGANSRVEALERRLKQAEKDAELAARTAAEDAAQLQKDLELQKQAWDEDVQQMTGKREELTGAIADLEKSVSDKQAQIAEAREAQEQMKVD